MGAALLYFLVRGLTEANAEEAVAHGRTLLRLEDALAMNVEATVQNWVLSRRWLVTAANWVYIWGHWPVIVSTLVWLYRSDDDRYRLLRNAMYISGAIGLVVFVLYPVAPPRLLGSADLVDTVAAYSNSYRVLQPPALVNKYAALPSLHVGWNLLVGILVWRSATKSPLRILGVASPMLMATAVVLTANHYVVDAVAGSAVALTGLAIASRVQPTRSAASPYGASDGVLTYRHREEELVALTTDWEAA